MLRVFVLFLIVFAGIIVGPILAGHQGYVLIQTDNYNIETSVTGLVIMLIVLILVLFLIEWILRRVLRTGARTRGWFAGRKSSKARKQTQAAMLKLAEGDHRQMEKLLARHADHAEQPVVNYLLAAEAAQQRGDDIRTNQYLERAAEIADTDQMPVDITRVRIQLARGEVHAARHGVDRLLGQSPRHPEVLRLAEQAYLLTGAYGSLLEILPSMAKADIHTDDEIRMLQEQAYVGMMNQLMAEEGSEGLKRWWKDQSRKTRHEVALQVAMATHLIECNDQDLAQEVILDGLKRQYDDRLVALMPKLRSGNPEQLEKTLRQLIKQNGTTPLLSSTLGQLLMKHGEWQQASEAFREALKQRPDAYDYAWLADALDKLHKPAEAAEMRREGLMLTLNNSQQP
ncbi:protoheme IX biogenesis protein HemY [Rahnella sp. C60]|jgi:HemY protein|uniref:Protoheme IX biogenesis protein HemY n=1 Tax=Rahnella perminowiae TaxID=2816244 RepID=A0ABS6KXB4_9GAMM|nr:MULTISPECIES: protoheme IX biogenesis protein HemY [Rahnella]UJD91375.1 protoheme IX biogenesis protein HemY [Rahnella aquatilis]MBU9812024.1 protoheme IX biogenesis protein HemY [Rahnella perminowiae]MBU9814276.1 protoheme IX biogenesis protein HemY [Rahnella perminowiae]MBU9825796.1 protoheme IX biogenesis protein HemY [Rahnella perminowiae]MBU9833989.1 protoheme IX biogenesis protein HemY [Rahnella perminowiae]